MKSRPDKSITLIELLVAVSLLAVMVLAFSSIDLFSRFHVATSDRRAQIQNEVSYVLEHMEINLFSAIGNESIDIVGVADDGPNSVIDTDEDSDGETIRLKVYIDASGNGQREPPITTGSGPADNQDQWRAYRFYDERNPPARRYKVQYCQRCTRKRCNNCDSTWEMLSDNITNFTVTKPVIGASDTLQDAYVEVQVTGCWDPDGAAPFACNAPDNPTATIANRIYLPSVSTN